MGLTSIYAEVEIPQDPNFFHYTRGRFIRDGACEMVGRSISFNVDELAIVAASAVGAKACVRFEKYPDGMYNKAFGLTMDNGVQVVAKLPNPNAGRPHFTTASEVATMEFRGPRCERVGAEYIIMEKVSGVLLDSVWSSMRLDHRFSLTKTIAEYQEAWMKASISHFGSLYFAEDLAGVSHAPLHDGFSDKKFAVGPSTGREWFDAGRATVEFDRGPWPSLEEYLAAIGHREMSCVNNVAQLPKSEIALYGPGTYQPTRKKKLKAIESYLSLIKYICPAGLSIASPCLWHSDLHAENIYVDPDAPTKIVGIIDWQSTEIAPLFYHARQPYFLDYDGPQLHGLERPRLPDNFKALGTDAQNEANALYAKQALAALYRTLIYKSNRGLYSSLEYQQTASFDLLLLGRNLLVDGEAAYLARIVELESEWADLPGVGESQYPFRFLDGEKEEVERDVNGSLLGMQAMQSIRESLGDLFPEQGIVRPDQYDEAKYALSQAKEFIIGEFARNEEEKIAWREAWPFDD
ncbi:hypothetical protein EMCG_04704 [[Emmonsia] crescens]|uniref:Aminoglycoside phosphotransferase domain-containing protein n=1 Tax=[Emmonsia] crescens TaxID=73230 RepID=A0A0G2J763_9EURO|nr:hypothetical protein EMCG_04704 [Emmonsia crescens UAMH 3008]